MSSFPSTLFPEFTVVSIPTRTNFRGVTSREIALFRGEQGWSEFSPFLEYDKVESSSWLQAAFEGANEPWPHLYREKVAINATLPMVAVNQVQEILSGFNGCSTVKIKVDDFSTGSELVEEVLNILPEAKIRLDVNGSWSLNDALLYLYDFNLRFGNVFEYIEQPCKSLSDLASLKAEIPMKIAVDESIRKNLGSDFSSLREVADIAIMKWAPLGGIRAALLLADEIGLPVVVSSALDSGIGISHSLALAASFKELDYACGLGTVSLLESDICTKPAVVENGYLSVERREPDFSLIGKYVVGEDRLEWWKNRISEIVASWEERR